MTAIDTSVLPDELVEKALRAYRFDRGSEVEDKIMINYWCQRQENGDFTLSVGEDENTIRASIETDDKSYERAIPKGYEDFYVDVYPIGDVRFERAELVAVSAVGGFSWAHEAFSCLYIGHPDEESLEGKDEKFSDITMLEHYYTPRELLGEPPECTVSLDSDGSNTDFMETDVRNATHCKTPNPWSYGSFGVLYEHETMAKMILSDDNVHGDKDQYSLTPPQSINQPFVEFR